MLSTIVERRQVHTNHTQNENDGYAQDLSLMNYGTLIWAMRDILLQLGPAKGHAAQ